MVRPPSSGQVRLGSSRASRVWLAAGRRNVFTSIIPLVTQSWTCHGKSNESMVRALQFAKIITSERVAAGMEMVDRGLFVSDPSRAYQDTPLPIGSGATISAPHMHAYCLELLEKQLQPGAKVLDVGSGTGYLTAVFSAMVSGDESGRVVGVEHVAELTDKSIQDVRRMRWAADLMESGKLLLLQGDGRLGYTAGAPYDAIHVGAASPSVPQALVDQLKPGGRIVIPVGEEHDNQELLVVDKLADGSLQTHSAMGVRYVPLTSLKHQERRAGKMQMSVT